MIEIAVYYFPNYHADSRNERLHGPGWTEWDLMLRAEPRFPDHDQPKIPLWGYEDETEPQVMAKKIDAAADHGISTFIFDWYWYNDGAYLQRALDEGFLNAPNNDRLKFALMWANHDWIDIHPAKASLDNTETSAKILYPGKVSPEAFERLIRRCVDTYFKHPSYWLMDGCPYFSVYELTRLLASFGGVRQTREYLDRFRAAVKAAGFPDLHLNAIVWNRPILPGEQTAVDPYQLIQELGFNSVTSYVWVHHAQLSEFPVTKFQTMEDQYFQYWEKAQAECPVPYYPNLTMGWDPSPRTVQSDRYLPRGYPFTPVIGGNTPEAFKQSAARIKARMEELTLPNAFITVNAWNEWTEGSYLEPDIKNGMGCLEAIHDIFGMDIKRTDT
jgi:hypothetical protein